jgi:hypothetical protein
LTVRLELMPTRGRRRDCQPLTVRLRPMPTGGWRPGGPRSAWGGGVSRKIVNALRRERSGPTRDNSFRQGPRCGGFLRRLKRRRRTSTTPPSRPCWEEEDRRLPPRCCLARSPLRTRTSSNRGRSHAKEVCRSPRRWGSNVLPGRSRQGSGRGTANSASRRALVLHIRRPGTRSEE